MTNAESKMGLTVIMPATTALVGGPGEFSAPPLALGTGRGFTANGG